MLENKKYAVIGDPISHSMSPAMHNDLFEFYQIPAQFKPVHIKKGQLEEGINELKRQSYSGFNVTIPHKTDIIPFLDDLDPLSEAIGAVNTVINSNGKLIGYNTDGSGYIKGLHFTMAELKEKKVLMVGTGGAAKAIYYTMASRGVKNVDVCNRTLDNAYTLVEGCKYSIQTNILTMKDAEEVVGNYDLIIQTTSIGMRPYEGMSPLALRNMNSNTFFSDIIYNPLETEFLRIARTKGAETQNGINMFVCQGALAFGLWTGIYPDIKRMTHNVLKQLGGIKC